MTSPVCSIERRNTHSSPSFLICLPLLSRSRCLPSPVPPSFLFLRENAKTNKVAADTGKIKAYREALADGGSKYPEIKQLKDDVNSFARSFPVIGFDEATMRYPAP